MTEDPHTQLTPSGAFTEAFIKSMVFTVLLGAVLFRFYCRVRARISRERNVIDVEAR